MSALAVFFGVPWSRALNQGVRTLNQEVQYLPPLVQSLLPPGDLLLVRSVLQDPPFENIREVPLLALSQKLAFLVAITSACRLSEL